MCRFTVYLGSPLSLDYIVTKPENSVINQSYDAELDTPLNGDGFGIAWYNFAVSETAGMFRDISPAWNNANLAQISEHIYGQCILAHVRAASPGLPVVQTNCHPFAIDNFTMMHNGLIEGFHKLRRAMLDRLCDEIYEKILGSTDSEHLFGLIMQEMRIARGPSRLECMVTAVKGAFQSLAEIKERLGITGGDVLNIAFCDGRNLVATRYNTHPSIDPRSLFYHLGENLEVSRQKARFSKPGKHGADVLISSEPLNNDSDWVPVPLNSLLAVNEQRQVHIEKLEI